LLKVCEGEWPLFITLTLQAKKETLRQMLDRLIRSFRRLRTRAIWKNAVDGAVFVIEVKKGSGSRKWHAHMHIIARGAFIPQADLSRAWKVASHGSGHAR
jgi:diadenosine tetraphosphate (Ap4A) HIT family hydrolase